MSNYWGRALLATLPPGAPARQIKLMWALSTWLDDGSSSVRVGFGQLTADARLSDRWAKIARRELRDAGLITWEPGQFRGDRTRWTVCLPKEGGTPVVPPSNGLSKGGPKRSVRGDPDGGKGGTPHDADQRKRESGLDLQANTSGSVTRGRGREAATVTAVFPDAEPDEIDQLIEEIETEHHPKNLPRYIERMAANGDLRLPCDDGKAPHTEACRAGDSAQCRFSFCECRCHTKPATNGKGPS